jgi:hypothetical protein
LSSRTAWRRELRGSLRCLPSPCSAMLAVEDGRRREDESLPRQDIGSSAHAQAARAPSPAPARIEVSPPSLLLPDQGRGQRAQPPPRLPPPTRRGCAGSGHRTSPRASIFEAVTGLCDPITRSAAAIPTAVREEGARFA